MILYTIFYKKANGLFWRKLNNIKGDEYSNLGMRVFHCEDETQISFPFNFLFRLGYKRWESMTERIMHDKDKKTELPKLNFKPFTIWYKKNLLGNWHKLSNVRNYSILSAHFLFITDRNGKKEFFEIPRNFIIKFDNSYYESQLKEMSIEAGQDIKINKR